ncbi:MAG TPA: hypothetical protein VKX33_02425 [Cyclobacteriaceae bacterium]|nr:hypothetical protein [Cyclobacteriaceae bacterium]
MAGNNQVIQKLREEIMALERFPSPKLGGHLSSFGLGPIEASFSGNAFPVGAIHEFISQGVGGAASTNGFIAGLLGKLMQKGRFCLWVSNQRPLFPQGLKHFGVEADRIIFIDVKREKDVLWTIEQGLKCGVLAAVVGELKDISFAESQRLQLAVERSRVTGFLHRHQPRREHALACVTRWKIRPIPSQLEEGMPGMGFPRWKVELIKVRNGRPGEWKLEWKGGYCQAIPAEKTEQRSKMEQHYA